MYIILGTTQIAVNVDQISHIWPTATGAAVYIVGREKPIQDNRSVDEILELIDVDVVGD